MPTLEQTQGCLLGLALGDALGAPFEGGILERAVWRVIGRTRQGEMRWTDDTQMTIDVVESFLAAGRVDPDDLALRFAASYRWSRGYGPGAAKVLKRITNGMDWRTACRSVYPGGSFGNGAAMRTPIVGLAHADQPAEIAEAARQSAMITHAHPLGVEGAVLIAQAAACLVRGCTAREVLDEAAVRVSHPELTTRLAIARGWVDGGEEIPRDELKRRLGNGVAAHRSCITALYLALRFCDRPFRELQRFIAACGGDADTIGAMAGGLWGAANGVGQLPEESLQRLEQRERLTGLASALHERLSTAANR